MKKLIVVIAMILPFVVVGQLNFIENTKVRTKKISQNTPHSEFGPAFLHSELWFSGFAPEHIEQLNKGNFKGIHYNLMASPLDDSGNLGKGSKIILTDISAGYHAGPVSFNNKTEELFITLSNYENAEVKNIVFQKKNIPLKIITLFKENEKWIKSEDFVYNNPSFSVGHPSISETGDTLIFASNKPDEGSGNTDLYMSIRKNGKWSNLLNLGSKINTSGNDMFPYFHKGKVLFYASDGKTGGKGGYDIWYSELTADGFGDPVNLSALNSANDDFGLVVHPSEKLGYFVSNKEGGAKDDDIYQVFFDGDYELELTVMNKSTGEPVSNISVNFNDNQKLYTDTRGKVTRKLEDATDYSASTSLEGHKNESVNITTKGADYGTIKKELFVEKVEIGQKFVMNNIYYLFDKWDLSGESKTELDRLVKVLNDNPSWKVELGSHTDCRGTDAYNNLLSSKRSDSAVTYITGNGIANNRILAKGYGENQLINQCKDGIACSEDEHKENRRTEFKILEMD